MPLVGQLYLTGPLTRLYVAYRESESGECLGFGYDPTHFYLKRLYGGF
jgi:hypothetical protein